MAPRPEELVVMPDGIRVKNDSQSLANYRLTVVGTGTRVRLRVGRPRAVVDTVPTATESVSHIALTDHRNRR
jgi:hypothetical protein